jgi:hypothetical protein
MSSLTLFGLPDVSILLIVFRDSWILFFLWREPSPKSAGFDASRGGDRIGNSIIELYEARSKRYATLLYCLR